MIKILYEAGHRPHVRKLLITVSSDFFKCAIGPSNSLLFSRLAARLPTDPSVVTLARRAHAGTAVPQAPEALTGSPELPSLGDRGALGSQRCDVAAASGAAARQ